MENMNITDIEINKITEKSQPREKAFFTIIRQSGLKPNTVKQLKIKHLEKIRELDTPIPCKINVPHEIERNKFGRHPSFIGEEGINYLKKYLTKRELQDKEKLTPESLLFTVHNKPNKQISIKEVSRTFKKIAHKVRRRNSDELQLNALREFFKQKSEEIGIDHVNYLMGNTPDNKYTPEDDEFYRKLYKEIVMDSLEIEPLTKSALRLRDNQIKEIRQQLAKDDEYISSILTVLYDNRSDRETGENLKQGDDFIELLKEVNEVQHKNLWDAWQSKGKIKLLPLVDITEKLTKTLKDIKKPYDELNQQIANDRKNRS